MKKRKLILVLIFHAFISAGVMAMVLSEELQKTAESLFQSAALKDPALTEKVLSQEFMENTSPVEMQEWMHTWGLHEVKSISWEVQERSGSNGFLQGVVTLINGETLPLEITLVEENGSWKVLYIQVAEPEFYQSSPDEPFPGDEERLSMVIESMDLFVSSLSNGSLDKFHGGISRIWRHQFSVEDLNEAYRVFLRLADDLQFILDQEPVIENASGPNEAGEWTVNGFYEDKSGVFYFNLIYIFEPIEGEWKLTGLSARFG